ncbi:hypothetical protein ACRT7A_003920, partial [Escherichia coli]
VINQNINNAKNESLAYTDQQVTKNNAVINQNINNAKSESMAYTDQEVTKNNCRFNWSTQQLCENMGLRRFFE